MTASYRLFRESIQDMDTEDLIDFIRDTPLDSTELEIANEELDDVRGIDPDTIWGDYDD